MPPDTAPHVPEPDPPARPSVIITTPSFSEKETDPTRSLLAFHAPVQTSFNLPQLFTGLVLAVCPLGPAQTPHDVPKDPVGPFPAVAPALAIDGEVVVVGMIIAGTAVLIRLRTTIQKMRP